jgi:hypothetical protein
MNKKERGHMYQKERKKVTLKIVEKWHMHNTIN